ncbi:ABC transporter ATPase [Flavobacteriaceae bacterium]|nr:ABC transporter ATPase [Flavobacteriaceae bacterium]
MYVDYQTMPDNSRLWVYQSSREFNEEELPVIEKNLINFLNHWTKHGSDLKASFKIDYNRFVTLIVDENFNGVSGCSIDASVHFLKEMQEALGLDLMDKMTIAYKKDEVLQMAKLHEFSKLAKEGVIDKETIVFNNLVQSKLEKENNWEVPASVSWHARYFK